jgi:hypothetical protein
VASGNPLIDQGILNRIKGSVTWANFPALAVTAPFLDKEGIRLALEGEASTQHGTMTGVTQSPEPYLPVSVTINLLKTQSLSDAYKSQMEDNSILGPGTVWPDVTTGLSPYQLFNMSIQSVNALAFDGSTPNYGVVLKGYYVVNNAIFS